MKKVFVKNINVQFEKLKENTDFIEVSELFNADMVLFFFDFDENDSPKDVLLKNVKEMEDLAKCAQVPVILYSDREITEPKNVNELAVMLTEDILLKLAKKPIIIREFSDLLHHLK